jgi:hypothetical protein
MVSKPQIRPNGPPASPERLAMAGRLRCPANSNVLLIRKRTLADSAFNPRDALPLGLI